MSEVSHVFCFVTCAQVALLWEQVNRQPAPFGWSYRQMCQDLLDNGLSVQQIIARANVLNR